MEVIQSFTIDHTQLKPGIYVSREDKGFNTFDLRITEPNKEPAVAPAAIHSCVHYARNEVKSTNIYRSFICLLHKPCCHWTIFLCSQRAGGVTGNYNQRIQDTAGSLYMIKTAILCTTNTPRRINIIIKRM